MEATALSTTGPARPAKENSVLFVDDEKRVLTSMRAMFRRDYNVLIANSGREALDILRDQSVDVVVSDQRMPGMTGVEVLKEVKSLAPRAMRILLTGYADLNAIEASINDAEVFRYLMKPCPSEELKEAIALAANVANGVFATESGALPLPANDESMNGELEEIEIQLPGVFARSESITDAGPAPAAAPSALADPTGVEVLVLSRDEELLASVRQALDGMREVRQATSVEDAIELMAAHPIGVLVTDTAVSEKEVAGLTAQLKQHVPQLVTIIASDRSDAQALINMINYGQIFRFLLKPLQVGQCRLSVKSAVSKHVELACDPLLARRHQVKQADDAGVIQGLVDGVLDKVKRLRGRFFQIGRMA